MITIDENKLAQALAYNKMKVFMPAIAHNEVQFENDDYIFHTENAEKVFDKWFDEYYTIIMEIAETQYSGLKKSDIIILPDIEPTIMESLFNDLDEPVCKTMSDNLLKSIKVITDDYKKNNMESCIHCGELNIKRGTIQVCSNSNCRQTITC